MIVLNAGRGHSSFDPGISCFCTQAKCDPGQSFQSLLWDNGVFLGLAIRRAKCEMNSAAGQTRFKSCPLKNLPSMEKGRD